MVTDQRGMQILLPNLKCYENYSQAVSEGEVQIIGWMKEAGYDVYAMMAAYTGMTNSSMGTSAAYDVACHGSEVVCTGLYDGASLHPFDTM